MTGTSYVLVDFPRMTTRPGTRAEEDASGASRAYLVEYAADDVINWSLDEYGNFEWVVIRTKQIKKDRVEDPEWRTETKWAYYDKQTYRIYGEDGTHRIKGAHGLAKLGQTPLFALRIPEGLWMLNRAGSLQLEHFNKSNALSWALTMGLVRDAGGVFGPRVEPDGGRELLHPAGAGGQVRVDGAGGQGLPDRGGQPGAAAGRDLPGVLPDAGGRGAGRDGPAERARASSGIFRSRRRCCARTGTRSRSRSGECCGRRRRLAKTGWT